MSLARAAADLGFFFALGVTTFAYAVYPVLIAVAARLRPRPVRRRPIDPGAEPMISVVLAVWNEEANLARRVANLLAMDWPAGRLEAIVASDGSTDGTCRIAQELASRDARVRLAALPENGGKAVALNAGVAAARGELILFADARQEFAPDVARRLAENFADPEVGSASGELVLIEAEGGVAANVGLYWRYEKWIRRGESAAGSMLGATGAIYAIRRELYRPLPPGTLLDDFLTPMRIVLAGRRAVFDGRAVATDRASAKAGQEFKRKARTLAGNFQAVAFEPALLWPSSNPSTWFQLWAHKLSRLAVPWALAAMLACSLAGVAAGGGFWHWLALLGQLAFYALALAGWASERRGRAIRFKPAGLAYTFVTLNAAAAYGLWRWFGARHGQGIWRKAY